MPQKIGLILSGGGGKGAYEVGVWRALNEFGIAQNISVISGTSVGALNAALFASQDVPTIEKVWNAIRAEDILYVDDVEEIFKRIIRILLPLLLSPTKITIIRSLLKELLLYGTFSRKGLTRIVNTYLNFHSMNDSGVHVYATCTQILPPKAEYFLLNNVSPEKAKKVLLASSAIPVVFGKEKIEKASYYDGGIFDNTPVRPVYNEGCKIIIVVLLNRVDYIRTEDYPNSTFMIIYPQLDPGGLIGGTLNFANVQEKIERGYKDAMRIIRPVYEASSANFVIKNMLEKIKEYDEDFRQYRLTIEEYQVRLENKGIGRKKSRDDIIDAIRDLDQTIDDI